jgi:hypothetical protein
MFMLLLLLLVGEEGCRKSKCVWTGMQDIP